MRVQGQASDEFGSPLPPGTPVLAFGDGVLVSNPETVTAAAGAFVVLAEGNALTPSGGSETTGRKEGADVGERVVFASGDFTGPTAVFREVVPWQEGALVDQDLRLAPAAKIPAPLKIQGIVAEPAIAAQPYVFVCNPTGASVSLADYYLEVNRPGVVHGPRQNLTGAAPAGGQVRVNVTPPTFLTATGDALKLVHVNPGGVDAPAAGADVVVDRVEFNATVGGTLSWEPGNTVLEDAPAPGVARILERAAFCADTNRASDFRVAIEPGLPENLDPTLSIRSPTEGQTIPAGQLALIEWTMSDDLFDASRLWVWVNVTYAGTGAVVLARSRGATSAAWAVPSLDVRGATVTVDVEDPLGGHATDLRTFHIARPDPFAGYGLVVAGLIAAVLAALILYGYLRSSRRMDRPTRPPSPPPEPPPARPKPAEEPRAVPEGKKVCPRCGTAVQDRDWVCFFCGFRFPGPPP